MFKHRNDIMYGCVSTARLWWLLQQCLTCRRYQSGPVLIQSRRRYLTTSHVLRRKQTAGMVRIITTAARNRCPAPSLRWAHPQQNPA